LIWNYITAPFILADPDFKAEELEPRELHAESWRRLRVVFPPRVITHSAEQTFYFDGRGLLRRRDYSAPHDSRTPIAEMLSGYQRFAGILVPTLCRLLCTGSSGAPLASPQLLDIEIFDAVFE
jgi:hypothetical protein